MIEFFSTTWRYISQSWILTDIIGKVCNRTIVSASIWNFLVLNKAFKSNALLTKFLCSLERSLDRESEWKMVLIQCIRRVTRKSSTKATGKIISIPSLFYLQKFPMSHNDPFSMYYFFVHVCLLTSTTTQKLTYSNISHDTDLLQVKLRQDATLIKFRFLPVKTYSLR